MCLAIHVWICIDDLSSPSRLVTVNAYTFASLYTTTQIVTKVSRVIVSAQCGVRNSCIVQNRNRICTIFFSFFCCSFCKKKAQSCDMPVPKKQGKNAEHL